MHPVLTLHEDICGGAADEIALPAAPRMIFVVHGALAIGERTLTDGEAWHGEGAVTLRPGETGVTLWRWELAAAGGGGGDLRSGRGLRATGDMRIRRGLRSTTDANDAVITSREKLAAVLDTLPAGELLMRGDSVAFPPGGCAYLHRHQGPGIRCLIEGGIRIDTHGSSTSYGPGGAWYESGPEPVFAQAAADRPSRFIRVMILPRALAGKSSLTFVNAADKEKPRVQQYKIFVDAPIARPGG